MRKIEIRKPIWSTQKIGIDHALITDDLEIEIMYRSQEDQHRLYPDTYTIKKEKALSYPTEVFMSKKTGKETPPLHVIPIKDLTVMSDDDKAKRDYYAMVVF